jgi:hypothetical protein
MKRNWLILLVLLLLAAPAAVQAQDFAWTTNADNVSVTVTAYTGAGGAVAIPDTITGLTVTSIGESAFENVASLTSIMIPSSVTSIGDDAFYSCTSLTNVMIPGSVTSIGNYAFQSCASLTSVLIPGSVTSIGYYAFSDCSSLVRVYFTGNTPSAGPGLFYGEIFQNPEQNIATLYYLPGTAGWSSMFGGLSAVLWNPSSLSQFDYTTNAGTITITGYTGPGGSVTIPFAVNDIPVTSIGQNAFFDCTNVTSIMIPGSVTSIGEAAFIDCSGLASVNVPNSVISIGNYAFLGCTSLTIVTIPGSVNDIGYGAFSGCNSLTGVYFMGNAPSVDPNVFSSDSTATVYYSSGNTGWSSTFAGLSSLLWNSSSLSQFNFTANAGTFTITGYIGTGGAVTIPFVINGLPVSGIGYDAFYPCSSITSVTVPGTVSSIGGSAFSFCVNMTNATLLDGVTTIPGEAFFNCSSLTNVTIPASVTSIGQQAFSATALTSVNIPGSVTNIGLFAFSVCGVLTNATIGYGVTMVGGAAFDGCSALTSVSIPASATSIGANEFDGCSSLTFISIPGSVASIGDYAFSGCSSLRNATIAEGVASIGTGTFSACTSLTNVTIPASVASIWEDAFAACSVLRGITVDAQNLFYSSLNGVLFDKSETMLIQFPDGLSENYVIPGSVSSIGNDAFNGSRLTSVTIPSSVTNIGDGAFAYCNSLTAIIVDAQNAFYSSANGVLFDESETALIQYPDGLSGSYVVPSSVTSIGNYAFLGCTSLTIVTIPGSITNIGVDAFEYCSGLTSVFFTGNAPTTPSGRSGGPPLPPPLEPSVFDFDNYATVYYLPGTTGWSSSFSGLAALLWNPVIQTGDGSFGVQNNQFGFNITNAANLTVVVEVCTNLANPVWVPLSTNTLVNGVFYFSEPFPPNTASRFYGLGLP